MAITREKRFILAELQTNRNKFWNVVLHDDGRVVSRWGRVGDEGCEKHLGEGEALFESKCREKERKGYVEQKTLSPQGTSSLKSLHPVELERVAKDQIAANSPEAAELIKRLVKANVHSILESTTLTYNAASGLFSTPLGIVTQDAIIEARRVLSTIGGSVARGAYGDPNLMWAANRFLNLVPQDLGRSRKSLQELFPDIKAIQSQNDLLDRLETSLQMALTKPTPDGEPAGDVDVPKVFEASLHLVHSCSEFRRLRALYLSTLNQKHAAAELQLKRVYSVEISSMKKAFEARSQEVGNVMELWHGTGEANILSILKDGFRISPPQTAHVTGKLLGNGIYFARQSTKSLNYAHGFWSGTRNKTCFLFLCDVAVGKYQVPKGGTSKRPDRGCDSYWARPGQTAGIVNDEIVVFDEAQINSRYLLEFGEP